MFDGFIPQNASYKDIALADKMFNPNAKSEGVLKGIQQTQPTLKKPKTPVQTMH